METLSVFTNTSKLRFSTVAEFQYLQFAMHCSSKREEDRPVCLEKELLSWKVFSRKRHSKFTTRYALIFENKGSFLGRLFLAREVLSRKRCSFLKERFFLARKFLLGIEVVPWKGMFCSLLEERFFS